jgi:hypothetical protein
MNAAEISRLCADIPDPALKAAVAPYCTELRAAVPLVRGRFPSNPAEASTFVEAYRRYLDDFLPELFGRFCVRGALPLQHGGYIPVALWDDCFAEVCSESAAAEAAADIMQRAGGRTATFGRSRCHFPS